MTIIEKLKNDTVFTENDYLRLRRLTSEDHDSFLHVMKEVSPIPGLYDLDGFDELLWKEIISSNTEVTLAVEKKGGAAPVRGNGSIVPAAFSQNPSYVGECMVKHPEPGVLELGIDIAPEYQNRGIATEAMRLLIEKIRVIGPELKLIARIYSDNLKSCHIIRKLGGVKVREESAEYKEAAAVAAVISEGSEKHFDGLTAAPMKERQKSPGESTSAPIKERQKSPGESTSAPAKGKKPFDEFSALPVEDQKRSDESTSAPIQERQKSPGESTSAPIKERQKSPGESTSAPAQERKATKKLPGPAIPGNLHIDVFEIL